ncbi:MAG: LytTR family DNA-binding domain-containing protein [Melioribacteraceae bacterium]|jgi:two-component system LytT family response regulator|nr:LytTR family DNA-binding domain-containing protein [Melioribacteraceae bacterium]
MIKAIIVDDEKNSREVISELVKECFDEIKIVAQTGDVKTSVEAIDKYQPNLLFLDIDLPDGTGFDILKKVDYANMKVVFITAHQEYAIKAIKFSAFDFILKPFNSGELIKTVRRVLDEQTAGNNALRFESILSNFGNSLPELKKIVLKTSDRIYLVNVKDIIRCEAENNYTNFYLANRTKIMVSKTIKTYETLLSEHEFLRVHQSHLVNLNFIQHFDKPDGGMLVLSDNSTIPVSHQKRGILLDYFSSLT